MWNLALQTHASPGTYRVLLGISSITDWLKWSGTSNTACCTRYIENRYYPIDNGTVCVCNIISMEAILHSDPHVALKGVRDDWHRIKGNRKSFTGSGLHWRKRDGSCYITRWCSLSKYVVYLEWKAGGLSCTAGITIYTFKESWPCRSLRGEIKVMICPLSPLHKDKCSTIV